MRRAGAVVALVLAASMLTACGPRGRDCDASGALQVQRAAFQPMPVTPIVPAPRPVIIPPAVRAPVVPARPAAPRPVTPYRAPSTNTSPWHGTPHVPLLPFLLMEDCD